MVIVNDILYNLVNNNGCKAVNMAKDQQASASLFNKFAYKRDSAVYFVFLILFITFTAFCKLPYLRYSHYDGCNLRRVRGFIGCEIKNTKNHNRNLILGPLR